MKHNGRGRAKILSQQELELLFATLAYPHRLICQISYYTGTRVGDVIDLRASDLEEETITIAGHLFPLHDPLRQAISTAKQQAGLPARGYLFPSKNAHRHISRQAVDAKLRQACKRLELTGVTTLSFKRTAIHQAEGQGVNNLAELFSPASA